MLNKFVKKQFSNINLIRFKCLLFLYGVYNSSTNELLLKARHRVSFDA